MNLADYVVSMLASRGVRHVFGYPGASVIPLMDAIDRHPDVKWVLTRHEGTAALCASAQAKLTGRLGVCVATAGPGATNMLTGILDASVDRAPMLAITGLVPTWKQSRAGFQDLDAARIFASVLSRSVACNHPDQLPVLLRDCIGQAEQDRAVVHLALPHDIQTLEARPNDPRLRVENQPEALKLHSPPDNAFDVVAPDLAAFGHVVIVVGPRAVGAGPAIEALADRLGAPIVSALDAKGIIDESHPCSLGVLGIFGSPGVEMTGKVLGHADAVLSFGLDDLAPFLVGQDGVQTRALVQCEPDFSSVTHQYHRARTLVGPIEETARALAARVPRHDDRTLLERARELKTEFFERFAGEEGTKGEFVHPARLLRSLSAQLQGDAVVALDVGDHTVWSAQFLTLTRRQRILVSKQLGTMGFCLPALIAAKASRPEAHVVGITGDGGFQMVLGDLMTAVQCRLAIVLIVFENGMLQRVVAQQSRPTGTVLRNPDFVAFARACGAEGVILDGSSDVDEVLRRALAHEGGPIVVDARIGPLVMAPMGSWKDGFTPLHFS